MFSTKVRAAAAVALAATAAVAVAGVADAGTLAPAGVVRGDTHVVTTDGSTGLVHTVRHGDGSWQSFGRLGDYTGVTGLTSTLVNGEENIMFQFTGPKGKALAHFVRHTDGTWNMGAPAPTLPAGVSADALSATTVNDQLNLVRRSGNAVQLAVLGADGRWSAWSAVPTNGGARSVSATGWGDTLRVVELSGDGKTATEYDRNAAGAWTAANAKGLGGYEGTEISAASVYGDVQMGVTTTGGILLHGVFHYDRYWDSFNDLGRAVDMHTYTPLHVAVANSLDSLQLVFTDSLGQMWHTIRYDSGNWQPLGAVEEAAGNANAGQVSMAAFHY
jgi:hypothetical protein